MSWRKFYDLFCDECGDWLAGREDAAATRRYARKLGWETGVREQTQRALSDFCPNCAFNRAKLKP